MEIVFGVMGIAVIVSLYLRLRDQDRTIKDLVDRLSARNYSEYVAAKGYEERSPDPSFRKPMSWHDDPTIDDVEERDY
ncbi:hypothetical protein Q8I65_23245 [Paenibacillus ottowii]|uniref:hypothetical protein n=1 Tax=Paenibacillus TaxID=44249 RepID=UPI0013ED3205|nr:MULTISPECIES: hypothetical protein [Paenibacillus]KAF6576567.1 hypothetical protein G9G53_01250 [Paenibacillus sp. EKM206P]KAF6591299.1 hypothetical protein G9G52_02715 [Paenibacillus sp. EKM205P]MDP1513079.1 hypothetical protein [Paenibacillus ottowii]